VWERKVKEKEKVHKNGSEDVPVEELTAGRKYEVQ
jgi:hypothetical protein